MLPQGLLEGKERRMKKSELLKLLETVPDDAEIVVNGNNCDILGDYSYSDTFTIEKQTAYGKRLDQYISNYANLDEPVEVWVIE